MGKSVIIILIKKRPGPVWKLKRSILPLEIGRWWENKFGTKWKLDIRGNKCETEMEIRGLGFAIFVRYLTSSRCRERRIVTVELILFYFIFFFSNRWRTTANEIHDQEVNLSRINRLKIKCRLERRESIDLVRETLHGIQVVSKKRLADELG